ncbi:hypothetical protein PIB30_056467 [Stylosanthes scabra]|uniref:Uncharacterized protein n=1 Tax=Stylosanthes scabra TaxID=79078 RepID=A0ABU6YL69_9FABA|nr:hypothetical protein [Stylosanthes scabra]
MGRNKSSEEDARNRMNAQLPLDMKRNKEYIVIDNTGSLDDLNEQFQNVLIEVSRHGLRKAASFKLLSKTNQNPLHHRRFPRTLLKKYQLQIPRGSSACCTTPSRLVAALDVQKCSDDLVRHPAATSMAIIERNQRNKDTLMSALRRIHGYTLAVLFCLFISMAA